MYKGNEGMCVSTEELRAAGIRVEDLEEMEGNCERASSDLDENSTGDSGAETEVDEPKASTHHLKKRRLTKDYVTHANQNETSAMRKGGRKKGGIRTTKEGASVKFANQSVIRRMTTIHHTLDQIKNNYHDRFQFHLTAQYKPLGNSKNKKKSFEFGEPFEFTEYVTKAQFQRELQDVREKVSVTTQAAASNDLRTPPRKSTVPKFPSPAIVAESPPRSACQKKQCSYWKSAKVWVNCESEACSYRIHAKCLGYPNVTESIVKKMPMFYCPIHNDLL